MVGMGWLARLARGDGNDAMAWRRGTAGTTGVGERRGVRGRVWGGWVERVRGVNEGGDGWVAAGSITETAGRAAERATKGDENFPAAEKVLSTRRPREKSAKNRRCYLNVFEFSVGTPRLRPRLIRETLFL